MTRKCLLRLGVVLSARDLLVFADPDKCSWHSSCTSVALSSPRQSQCVTPGHLGVRKVPPVSSVIPLIAPRVYSCTLMRMVNVEIKIYN